MVINARKFFAFKELHFATHQVPIKKGNFPKKDLPGTPDFYTDSVMNNPIHKLTWAACLAVMPLTSYVHAAQTTNWNAYGDFYLSPTAAGWSGATSPSAAGAAWGYYAANVNGFGLPSQIGSYFTSTSSGSGSQNLYQYSNVAPIGDGPYVGASGWSATGGAGFPYYGDSFSWGSSLGRYETPWFAGAPGLSQGLTNLIWLQSGWLGSQAEGIAPVLTWKAPASGVYTFSGLFVAGNQPSNSASVAIVDSLSGTPLARTVLANDSTQSFSFTKSYSVGDVVQFQVGNDFSSGNVVGLQAAVTAVPEPSALSLAGLGLAAAAFYRFRLKR